MADEGPLVRVIRAVCYEGSPFSLVERLVALAIAAHMNRAGESWPSHRCLAGWTRASERAVRRAVHRLCGENGLFETVVGGARKGARYASTRYRLRPLRGAPQSTLATPRGDSQAGQGGLTGLQKSL